MRPSVLTLSLVGIWLALSACAASPTAPRATAVDPGPRLVPRADATKAARAASAVKAVKPADGHADTHWFDAEDPRCRSMRHALRCVAGTVVRIGVMENPMTGPTACLAWCATGAGQRHGEYRQTLIGTTRAGELLRGRYRRGRPAGTWTTWTGDTCRAAPGPRRPGGCDSSRCLSEESYDTQGLLDGTRQVWSPAGRLVLREDFQHGVRAGCYESFHPDGKPRLQGRFAPGSAPEWGTLIKVPLAERAAPPVEGSPPPARQSVPVGVWREWYASGRLAIERSFDAAGRPDGAFCFYRPDGTRIACHDLRGGTGTLIEYDEAGGRMERLPFVRGELEGIRVEWIEGRVARRQGYRRGQPHGVNAERDEQGRLTVRESYRDGVLHGACLEQSFNSDGSREITTGRYCWGNKCGRWTRTIPSSGFVEVEVFDARGTAIAGWSRDREGVLQEPWSAAAERRKDHQKCLRALAEGGCCDPEQHPPRGARMCINGDPGR